MTSEGTAVFGAGERRRAGWLAGRIVRIVLLAVMAASVAGTLAAAHPRRATVADFLRDTRARAVRSVVYDRSTSEIRWTLGWWRGWHTTTDPTPPEPASTSASPWLLEQINVNGRPEVRVSELRTGDGLIDDRALAFPLGTAFSGAAPITFLMMLVGDRRWSANRWAYLWLFTIGVIGAPLYLLLEPEPLWWGRRGGPRGNGRTDPHAGPLIRGGRGFLLAVVSGSLIGVLAHLVG